MIIDYSRGIQQRQVFIFFQPRVILVQISYTSCVHRLHFVSISSRDATIRFGLVHASDPLWVIYVRQYTRERRANIESYEIVEQTVKLAVVTMIAGGARTAYCPQAYSCYTIAVLAYREQSATIIIVCKLSVRREGGKKCEKKKSNYNKLCSSPVGNVNRTVSMRFQRQHVSSTGRARVYTNLLQHIKQYGEYV